jgi:rubredoxin
VKDKAVARFNDSNVESRLRPETRLECRICWHVYDPSKGDEYEQIPPGTPFTELPEHWRCPQCDADKGMFLPIDDGDQ